MLLQDKNTCIIMNTSQLSTIGYAWNSSAELS